MKKFFAAIAAFGLAATMAFAQDYNEAVDAFNAGAQALESNKTEALANFRSALEKAQAIEGEEAAELVIKCKEAIPGVLMSIAKEKINEGLYDEALSALAETKAVATEYEIAAVAEEAEALIPNVYMRKGSTLLKEKDFAGAAVALEEVTKLTPEDSKAFLLLGQAQLQNGATPAAVAALEKANELGEPQAAKLLSTTFLKQGQALLKGGKTADAIAALEKSNSYMESANAYKLIASAYTKSGKSADAIEAYKKYLEVNPNAKDADDIIFTIAATAQKAGDKATAKEYYNKLTSDAKYGAQAAAQLKAL